jgi:hypothetical protein
MAILRLLRIGLYEITNRMSRFKADQPKLAVRAFFTPPNARWTTIFVIVSVLYAANVIQWSLRFGRLAMDPVFDDVGYLFDGLQRLNILERAGFHAFCQTFINSPPHSPWSTSLALISFALMGVHDWAPYTLNSLLIFLLLCVAWDLVGQDKAFTGAAIISIILCVQLPFQAVLDFRPDFAVALFTAAFSLLILKMGCYEIEAKTGNHFWVGILAGLAYLTKPSFFPHTTVMLFAALLIFEICRGLRSGGRFDTWGIVRRFLVALAGAILIAGPYFVVSWHTVWEYFQTNTGGGKEAALWKVPGGFWASLSNRLGYSTDLMLGRFTRLLTIWLFLGLGFALLQRNSRAILFILGGGALATVSLLLISAGQMSDPHFSYTWILLFILTTLFAVSELVTSRFGTFLAIVFCIMAIFTFYKAPPTRNVWLVINDTARGTSMNELIVERIAARAKADPDVRPTVVYSTFMGKVNAASQNWLALTHNNNIEFRDLHRSGDIDAHLTAIQSADFVEIADSDSQWLDRWLPSASLQSSLLEKVRSLSAFEELAPVVGKEGTVFLFEKRI